jgi:hypothetical protein
MDIEQQHNNELASNTPNAAVASAAAAAANNHSSSVETNSYPPRSQRHKLDGHSTTTDTDGVKLTANTPSTTTADCGCSTRDPLEVQATEEVRAREMLRIVANRLAQCSSTTSTTSGTTTSAQPSSSSTTSIAAKRQPRRASVAMILRVRPCDAATVDDTGDGSNGSTGTPHDGCNNHHRHTATPEPVASFLESMAATMMAMLFNDGVELMLNRLLFATQSHGFNRVRSRYCSSNALRMKTTDGVGRYDLPTMLQQVVCQYHGTDDEVLFGLLVHILNCRLHFPVESTRLVRPINKLPSAKSAKRSGSILPTGTRDSNIQVHARCTSMCM